MAIRIQSDRMQEASCLLELQVFLLTADSAWCACGHRDWAELAADPEGLRISNQCAG